jgi:hypothetical protein
VTSGLLVVLIYQSEIVLALVKRELPELLILSDHHTGNPDA